MNSRRLGLIQSRGLGDIIIALPIAKYYADRGVEVHWPIDARFLPSFRDAVDYVRFIPFAFESNFKGFVQEPMDLLKQVPCDRIVTLYSYLSNSAIANQAYFLSLKFDEYKYAIAGVPFGEKWKLSIRRNAEREEQLFKSVVRQSDYIVVQDQGSNFKKEVMVPPKYRGMQRITIDERTDCIFDWLKVLENARCLVLIDSCMSNLVEQLNLPVEKIFILRSEIRFSPVLRNKWHYYGEPDAAAAILQPTARPSSLQPCMPS